MWKKRSSEVLIHYSERVSPLIPTTTCFNTSVSQSPAVSQSLLLHWPLNTNPPRQVGEERTREGQEAKSPFCFVKASVLRAQWRRGSPSQLILSTPGQEPDRRRPISVWQRRTGRRCSPRRWEETCCASTDTLIGISCATVGSLFRTITTKNYLHETIWLTHSHMLHFSYERPPFKPSQGETFRLQIIPLSKGKQALGDLLQLQPTSLRVRLSNRASAPFVKGRKRSDHFSCVKPLIMRLITQMDNMEVNQRINTAKTNLFSPIAIVRTSTSW